MARTLSSVPSVKRGTLTSHNGNSEQMDRAKECIAVANEGNPADFHALETNRPCLFDAFRQCGVLAHGFPGGGKALAQPLLRGRRAWLVAPA